MRRVKYVMIDDGDVSSRAQYVCCPQNVLQNGQIMCAFYPSVFNPDDVRAEDCLLQYESL